MKIIAPVFLVLFFLITGCVYSEEEKSSASTVLHEVPADWILLKKSDAQGGGMVQKRNEGADSDFYFLQKDNGRGWLQLQTRTPVKVQAGKKYTFSCNFGCADSELSSLFLLRVTKTRDEIPKYDDIDRSNGYQSQSLLPNCENGQWLRRVGHYEAEKDGEVFLNIILCGNPCSVRIGEVDFAVREFRIPRPDLEKRTDFKFSEEEVYEVLKDREYLQTELKTEEGKTELLLNGKKVLPVFYRPEMYADEYDKNRYEEFIDAGVPFMQVAMTLSYTKKNPGVVKSPGNYDFERIERTLMQVLRRNPKANVILAFSIKAPCNDWGKSNLEECWANEKGLRAYGNWGNLEDFVEELEYKNSRGWKNWWFPSYSSIVYQQQTCQALEDITRYLMERPLGKAIAGFAITGGHDAQFQYKRPDHSAPAQKSFRQWLEQRYGNLKRLNSFWKTRYRSFDEIKVPSYPGNEQMPPIADFGVLADYELFKHCESWKIRDLFARAVKKAAAKKTVVASYSFPSHYNYSNAVAGSAVDLITNVYGYAFRRPGYPVSIKPAKSYSLNNKLWLLELDMRSWTYPANNELRDLFLGCARTLPDWISTHKKMSGIALAEDSAWWYYSMNCYFDAPEIMSEIGKTMKIAEKVKGLPRSGFRPDVCVVKSLSALLHKNSKSTVTSGNTDFPLSNMMFELSGVPYDVYYLDEVLNNPELQKYKMYVFMHDTLVTTAQRKAIDRLLKKDGRVLVWVYSSGYMSEKGKSIRAMSDLIGMRIGGNAKYVRRTPLTVYRHPLTKGVNPFQGIGELRMAAFVQDGKSRHVARGRDFWVADSRAEPLARFAENGKTAMALRRFPDWTSVYCAAPFALGNRMIHNLAKYAGAYTCAEPGQSIFMNGNFLSLHGVHSGECTITLPLDRTAVFDADTDAELARNVKDYTFDVKVGKTFWFYFK